MDVPLTLIPCQTVTLDGNVGLVSGARVEATEPMVELTPAIIDKVASETGRSDGAVLDTFPKPNVVGVMPFTGP